LLYIISGKIFCKETFQQKDGAIAQFTDGVHGLTIAGYTGSFIPYHVDQLSALWHPPRNQLQIK
jgi:hypothetical protein